MGQIWLQSIIVCLCIFFFFVTLYIKNYNRLLICIIQFVYVISIYYIYNYTMNASAGRALDFTSKGYTLIFGCYQRVLTPYSFLVVLYNQLNTRCSWIQSNWLNSVAHYVLFHFFAFSIKKLATSFTPHKSKTTVPTTLMFLLSIKENYKDRRTQLWCMNLDSSK